MQTISSGGQSQAAQQAAPPVTHRGSTPATPFGAGNNGGAAGNNGAGGNSGYNSLAKSSSGDTWSALGSGVSLGWPSTRLVEFWTVLDHFGQFWTILDRFDHFGPFGPF